jgi:ABC-type lipoprotein export system ATPase subunit
MSKEGFDMGYIKLFGGTDKQGNSEKVDSIKFESGCVYTIVGKTGSGKSQLIEDIEARVKGDGVTKRFIEISEDFNQLEIAQLSQNMKFILDLSVLEFINIRYQLLGMQATDMDIKSFLTCVNTLCGEKVYLNDRLTRLSGGQSRSVMITDIALNNLSKIVLIDEIENAGIDKVKALELLINNDKIVIVVTHDPLLGLYGKKRIIMQEGGIFDVIDRTEYEKRLITRLNNEHKKNELLRNILRSGNTITEIDYAV